MASTRAIEWNQHNRDRSYLLRGGDLRAAEQWLTEAAQHESPKPTDLQIEYLVDGRRRATRATRMRFGALTVALITMLGLAVIAFLQRTCADCGEELSWVTARRRSGLTARTW